MSSRTTLVLDPKAREAAEIGVPQERRRERARALRRLFVLFADNDPKAEVARLKAEVF